MPQTRAGLRLLALLLLGSVAGAAPAADAPFLWQVQGPGATRHMLMGSVHVLPASAYPLPAGLQRAYEQTAGLVLETDADALDESEFQMQMLTAAIAPDGLKSAIRPELYSQLQRHAGERKLPMTLCDPFKAWFCALSLELFSLQARGISGEYGLDQHFFARAMHDQRPVRWLEAPGEQLAIFTKMTQRLSEQFLASTLKSLSEPGRDPSDVVRQWQANDSAALEALVLEMKRDFPEAYERLLGARNRNWMVKLEALLGEARPQLIIVGAAHLVGGDGLPALLAARGWQLAPVADAPAPPPAAAERPRAQ